MRVSELSEDDLLARIVPLLPRASGIEIASGDDCAVLGLDGPRVAVSTDMLVEGTHFTRQWSSGYDVGWRAAMQNLADSVAMGARPVSLFASVELPGDLPAAWVDDFARGMGEAARVAGAGVDGGDLTAGPAICIGVTVVGDLEGRPANLRGGARPGQKVIHCGRLGFSAAGYELLASGWKDGEEPGRSRQREAGGRADGDGPFGNEARAGNGGRAGSEGRPGGGRSGGETDVAARGSDLAELVACFLRPDPPLGLALAACRAGQLGGLMDVSDGLVRDARRMARASGVWIDLDPEAIGTHIALLEGRGFSRAKATECVLTGGEDHGFLATTVGRACEGRVPEGFGVIGTVTAQAAAGRVTLGGREIEGLGGWDHFSS
ncbi:MAG: thiamine-monophosphate kinase [Actinomycetaceae bacterium]|nr:thiamine-monophosphate kinase [Actinomycetaceae bacterium]